MNTQAVCEVLSQMSGRMEEHKEFLTELDNAIADGDHGINMARGFTAATQKLPDLASKDIGTIFKTFGMTLLSAVGGSAGPLYGTAFMKAGAVMAGKDNMTGNDLSLCLQAAIDGVILRGKATRGEKTMLDAMIPANEALCAAKENGASLKEALRLAVKAAWDGVEYTKTIAATKGRASYIGERSIGHQDPGATSFSYLLEVIEQSCKEAASW